MYGSLQMEARLNYIKEDAKRIMPLPSKVPYEFGASLGCAGSSGLKRNCGWHRRTLW
jgi:hypothetical protein